MARQLPALDLQWKEGELKLSHRNQETVQVNYYLMDIELLLAAVLLCSRTGHV